MVTSINYRATHRLSILFNRGALSSLLVEDQRPSRGTHCLVSCCSDDVSVLERRGMKTARDYAADVGLDINEAS